MMRAQRVMVGLSAMTIVLGTSVISAPGAVADGGSGGDTKRVRVRDDCDPVTFTAAGIPCTGDGETTVAEFLAELQKTGAVDDWDFKPDDFHIDRGDRIRAVNTGGEFHTFTEVAAFGGGCIEDLNAGQDPVPECDDFFALLGTTGIAPGAALSVRGLDAGTHLFECLIHPWMRSTVDVRADDDDHDDHSGHHG